MHVCFVCVCMYVCMYVCTCVGRYACQRFITPDVQRVRYGLFKAASPEIQNLNNACSAMRMLQIRSKLMTPQATEPKPYKPDLETLIQNWS